MAQQTQVLPQVLGLTLEVRVQGSKGKVWPVRLGRDNAWVCDCPSWKMQPGVDGAHRQCKHTRAAGVKLGELVIAGLNS